MIKRIGFVGIEEDTIYLSDYIIHGYDYGQYFDCASFEHVTSLLVF